MMTLRRSVVGPLLAATIALSGLAYVSQYTLIEQVPVVVVAPTPTPTPSPKTLCLQRLAPFSHFALPVNPEEWGPGKDVKHSQYDFGPSAVPLNIDQLTPAEAKAAVRQIYIRAICGDLIQNRGPNFKIYQTGRLSTDSSYDPNEPVAGSDEADPDKRWERQARDVEAYLDSIDWDASYLEQRTMPQGMVTLTMRTPGGPEPTIYAVETQQPRSWYLRLAFRQTDGTVVYAPDWKRLECFFQSTYEKKGDVPPVLPFTR